MTRVVRFACCLWMACFVAGVSSAQAQAARPTSVESPFYAEFVGGGTFGHTASGSLGGEVGYQLTESFDLFFEGGHMFDVATTDNQSRADRVAAFIGGTAGAKQVVNYFSGGIKYHIPFASIWAPYIGVGGGMAKVRNRTRFVVDGTDVTEQLLDQFGVELGNDLTDSLSKGFLMIGVGAQRPIFRQYFLDISYRFGHIYTRQKSIVDDVGINTNRVQGGFGIRF